MSVYENGFVQKWMEQDLASLESVLGGYIPITCWAIFRRNLTLRVTFSLTLSALLSYTDSQRDDSTGDPLQSFNEKSCFIETVRLSQPCLTRCLLASTHLLFLRICSKWNTPCQGPSSFFGDVFQVILVVGRLWTNATTTSDEDVLEKVRTLLAHEPDKPDNIGKRNLCALIRVIREPLFIRQQEPPTKILILRFFAKKIILLSIWMWKIWEIDEKSHMRIFIGGSSDARRERG